MITDCLQIIPAGTRRLLVAFSGGLDSTVLLHLVRNNRKDLPVLAWHINHGLQAAANDMESFCRQWAADLDLELRVDRLNLDPQSGNLEARARRARYQLFEENSGHGDCLLTAHHLADQAETGLLNLFRGSGIRGLRGIASSKPLGFATLIRPLLAVNKTQLLNYATEHELTWFEDPSNVELNYNRNYLRHRVMPVLKQRWPAIEQKIVDAMRWQDEAQQLLDELAELDLADGLVSTPWGTAIDLPVIDSQTPARQRNLLRHWLSQQAVVPAPGARLDTLIQQLSRNGGTAEISMPGYRLRRFDDKLFLVRDAQTQQVSQGFYEFHQAESIRLPGCPGQWSRQQILEQFEIEDLQQSLSIGFRHSVADQQVSRHHLKRFFQRHRVPPWARDSLPLVFVDKRLSGYLP